MELGGLYNTVVEKNIPLFASLEITTVCNQKCVHCYNVGADVLSFETCEKVMKEAAELGTLFLSVTGGEPLLHGDIWDILECAADNDFAVLLYTNATLIGPEEAVRLKRTGIYHVDTTLLGASARTHDALAGEKGSFEKTIDALKLLKEQKINVAVKTPVMKENAGEIEDIKKMLADTGVKTHIASPLIFARDDGNTGPLSHRPDDDQLRDFFSRFEIKGLTDCKSVHSCHFGRCTFAVRANGDVNPCVSVPLALGNIKRQTLKEIWTKSAALESIRAIAEKPLSACENCDLAGWCFRCEGISFTEEGRLFVPSEELCRMAKIRKEVSCGKG